RRRHTRCYRDWSSDVCSSDLPCGESLAKLQPDAITAGIMSEKKLPGKIALITGASKGLGKAMALALAEAGARLALVSRNLEQLRSEERRVGKEGRRRWVRAEG